MGITPAIADFRYREPLLPRLARKVYNNVIEAILYYDFDGVSMANLLLEKCWANIKFCTPFSNFKSVFAICVM